ncbi:MAG: Tryptophan synthase alpha chain [Myxococcaceae bacterium]|nr:Tryptophan synthase alpha chain [Myxococcaceae bacterium]
MVSARRRWSGSRLALLLTTVICACSQDENPATQLILVADTDSAEIERIRFEVRGTGHEDGLLAEAAHAPGSGPSYVSLERGEGGLGPLTVSATGFNHAGALRLSRTQRVSFVPRQTRVVLLHLFASCLGPPAITCSPADTCAASGCVAQELGESELLPWSGVAPGLSPKQADAATLDAGTPGADASPPRRDAGPDAGDAEVDAGPPELMSCGDAGVVDVQSDFSHCGNCTTACVSNIPAMLHAVSSCMRGSCAYSCAAGFGDCDLKTDNGCEADLGMPDRCGSCTNKCPKGQMCMAGTCFQP